MARAALFVLCLMSWSLVCAKQSGLTVAPGGAGSAAGTIGSWLTGQQWEVLSPSGQVLATDTNPGAWGVSAQPGGPPYILTVSVPTATAAGSGYMAIDNDNTAGGGVYLSFSVGTVSGSPPPIPTNLTAVAGNQSVTLSWNPSAGATSYAIWLVEPCGGNPWIATGVLGTTYTLTGLTNGVTYVFAVGAQNAAGMSQLSNDAIAIPPGVLTAPTNLVAVGSSQTVTLNWSAVSGATGYTVYRGFVNGGPYPTQIQTTTNSLIDTPLIDGFTYYYVVVATDAAVTSGYSNQASATPQSPPGTPQNLTATPGNQTVTLNWTPVSGATSYIVSRGTAQNDPYVTQFTTTNPTYLDNGLTNGTTYYYVVQAVSNAGPSAYSNEASATPNVPPPAPTALTALGGNGYVSLNWSPSAGATSYVISRGTASGGPYTTQFQTTAIGYADNSVQNFVTYYYVVQAVNSVAWSADSNQASATPYGPPSAPLNLTATPGASQISLSWTASPGATSYTLSRGTVSGGPYSTTIGTTSATTLVDTNSLVAGTTYYYVVVATNTSGNSPNSNQASATFLGPPVAPVLYAYPGNQQVTLVWNAIQNASTYWYGTSTSSSGPFTWRQAGNVTTYVAGGLTNGTPYFFEVYATGVGGTGPDSNVATAIPTGARVPIGITPNPPTGYLPDALALPEWEDQTIPEDGSDAPGGGPSSIFHISLPFGVVDVSSGADIVMDDPIVGQIGFGRSYRTALAAGNISSPGLPAGWTHNFDYRIYAQSPATWGAMQVVYPNGASETLTPIVTVKGQGDFVPKGHIYPGLGGESVSAAWFGGPTGTFIVPANAPYVAVGSPSSTIGYWTSITLQHNGLEAYVFWMDAGDTCYRLHQIVNDAGSVTNLTYSSGRLVNVSSASSVLAANPYSNAKSINLMYSGGLLQSVSATGIPGSVKYNYNGQGEIASVTNIDDAKVLWSYTYQTVNGAQYLVSDSTENSGGSANVVIDPATGRATSLTDANGRAHTYGYSGLTKTSPSGTSTVTSSASGTNTDQNTSVYNGSGQLTKATDAANNSSTVSWLGGQLLTATPQTGNGSVITRDTVGNPTKILYPHRNYTSLTWAYSTAYPFGQLSKSQEFGSDGSSMSPTTYQYYASTNLASGQLAGFVSSVTYPSGQVVNYTYTGLGQVMQASTLAADGLTPANTQVSYSVSSRRGTYYEMFGKPYSVTDAMQNTTSVSYGSDLMYEVSDPLSNTTLVSLNANRQLTAVEEPTNTTTSFSYQAPGKPMTVASASGASGVVTLLQTGYDSEYGPNYSADPNQTTVPSEDPLYNLSSLFNGNNKQMYGMSWDPFTMVSTETTAVTSASPDAWSYQLDHDGNVATFTGPGLSGSVIRNANEQPTSINWSSSNEGAPSFTYGYDGFGRVQTSTGPSGATHTYTYDSAGQLLNDACQGYSVGYTYAANGARLTMTVNTATGGTGVYSYTYDALSRVTSITLSAQYNSGTVNYFYDADGHVSQVTTPEANIFYQRDGGGRVNQLLNLSPAGVVDDPTSQMTGPDGYSHSVFSTFGLGTMTYDTNSNLIGFDYVVRQGDEPVGNSSYLTGSANYGYGNSSQLESEVWTGSVPAGLYYQYDGAENLQQLRNENFTTDTTSDELQTSQTTFTSPIQYDASGKMTSFRGVQATWYASGQLLAAGNNSQMNYDADGHRLSQASAASEGENYAYDGDSLVYQNISANSNYAQATFYIWGPTGPVMEVGSKGVWTYTFDPNGSLVARIGPQGQPGYGSKFFLSGSFLFDAYGLTVMSGSANPNDYCPFAYKGQAGYVSDLHGYAQGQGAANGWSLVYCHNRWYDPFSGRWISRDPAGLEGGENAYEFCSDNPLTNADPSGLAPPGLHSEFDCYDPELQHEINKLTARFAKDMVLGPTQDFGDSYGRWEMGRESGWATAGYGVLAGLSALDIAEDAVGVGELNQAAIDGLKFEEKIRKGYNLSKVTMRTEAGALRFVDGFDAAEQTIYEVKSGKYVSLSKRVLRQITTDTKLVAEGKAERAVWVFRRGTVLSEPLIKALESRKIGIAFSLVK